MSEELAFFNPWKQFTGCWLPNWLLEREELDLGPKVAYARLAQFAGRNAVARVHRPILAHKLAAADRSVGNWLAKLEACGLIHVTHRPNRPSEYRFLRHPWMDGAVEMPGRQELPVQPEVGRQDLPIPGRQDFPSGRQDLPAIPIEKRTLKRRSARSAPEPRPEVQELSSFLADSIVANGANATKFAKKARSIKWLTELRLLLDDDLAVDQHGREVPYEERVAKARRAITWCQGDEFWRKQILSPENLRAKYERLRLEATDNSSGPRRNGSNGYRPSSTPRRPVVDTAGPRRMPGQSLTPEEQAEADRLDREEWAGYEPMLPERFRNQQQGVSG
jgi:hypothetical protein